MSGKWKASMGVGVGLVGFLALIVLDVLGCVFIAAHGFKQFGSGNTWGLLAIPLFFLWAVFAVAVTHRFMDWSVKL